MKFPSEIFECELNERQSSEIPWASSPLALTYSAIQQTRSPKETLFHLGIAQIWGVEVLVWDPSAQSDFNFNTKKTKLNPKITLT